MKRLLACLLLALVACVAPPAVLASQQENCGDIAAYLETVDTAITADVHALVTRPGWTDDVRRATGVLELAGSDTTSVTAEDVEPFRELFAIPGDVLAAMDASAVPDGARDVHDTSVAFWGAMPEWLDAMVGGDEDAFDAAFATLNTHSQAAATALAGMDAACPGLIDAHLEHADQLGAIFDQLESAESGPDLLANASIEDLDGIGVYFLILPESWSMTAQPVATPVREPVTVKAIPREATPAATPGT